MAPKKVDQRKTVLIAFRLDEEQTTRFDAAVSSLGLPGMLGLSRSELARYALLVWMDSTLKPAVQRKAK
jgi:hypothetical protein